MEGADPWHDCGGGGGGAGFDWRDDWNVLNRFLFFSETDVS